MYAIAKLKKNIKGFGLRKFKEEALQIYEETCQLLAEGDQSRLRQVGFQSTMSYACTEYHTSLLWRHAV